MISKLIPLIIFLFCGACSQNKVDVDCMIDFEFKAKFLNCVNLASVREAGVYVDKNLFLAYECLEGLTEEKSFIENSNDSGPAYAYSDSVNYSAKTLKSGLGGTIVISVK